jgi:hypothetical protein
MYPKFLKDWFRLSKGVLHRQSAWRSAVPTFIFKNKKTKLKMALIFFFFLHNGADQTVVVL